MWILTENKSVTELQHERHFEWLSELKLTPQDPIHHGEGNVMIHTIRVIDEMIHDPNFEALSEQNKEILWCAALFHDIEKRSTTILDEETGRISAPGHAKKGEYTVRRLLYELGSPFAIREQICKLVKYHGLPLWFFNKPDFDRKVIQASCDVPLYLLSILTMADAKGRVCPDMDELIIMNEMFKDYALELGCFSEAYSFGNYTAKYEYFIKEDRSPTYIPYENQKGIVYMMSGLPGSGKDTYILNNFHSLPEISLDNLRRKFKARHNDSKIQGQIIQLAKEQAKIYMRDHVNGFVFNATNITKSMRDVWINLFTSYDYRVKIIYVEVPYKTLFERNSTREHKLPLSVLHKMIDKLEVPSITEAHYVEYVV